MTAALGRHDVLVVDDDRQFRTLVREVLERAGFAVDEASNGGEALATARRKRPSLVILDVCLPDISGYEVLREFHDNIGEDLPVVFVSGQRIDRNDRVSGLLLGAEDYLFKPFDADELLARIRRSLARAGNGSPPKAADVPSPLSTLTPRELEVLELLANGYSQTRIAQHFVISARTVGTHIQRILTKLNVHSRVEAVAVALRGGLDERGSSGQSADRRDRGRL